MRATLLLLLVLGVFAAGNALSCYNCAGPPCDDPFDDTSSGVTKINCPAGYACTKLVLESTLGSVTSRACVDPSVLVNDTQSSSTMFATRQNSSIIKSISLSFCYEDACNGASSISVTLSTFFLLSVPFLVKLWH